MDEQAARTIIAERFSVSRETMAKLDLFAELIRRANEQQNLVSATSLDQIWRRHLLDSAQLLRFVSRSDSSWVDLGSGAGLPGLVIALLHPGPVTLVEERRLRIDFLCETAQLLGVNVEILGAKAERLEPRSFDVISARAFAPLGRLLDLASPFSTAKSLWVLPKGRNAQSELEALGSSWQGEFRLEESLTDVDARIIVAQGVRRGSKRKRE